MAMDNRPVAIDIILDGKRFGARSWHHVPRVGDTIMLRNGEIFATVRRVVWAEDDERGSIHDCLAQLICDTTKDIEAKP